MPGVDQGTLIDVPGQAGEPPARRTTSKGIATGVTELEQRESGRFELAVRPLDSRISWRSASVREVVEVWRKARRPAA